MSNPFIPSFRHASISFKSKSSDRRKIPGMDLNLRFVVFPFQQENRKDEIIGSQCCFLHQIPDGLRRSISPGSSHFCNVTLRIAPFLPDTNPTSSLNVTAPIIKRIEIRPCLSKVRCVIQPLRTASKCENIFSNTGL